MKIFKSDRHAKGAELAKKSSKFYKSSFQNLPDKTVYHDPLGFMTSGGVNKNGINGRAKMWEEFKKSGLVEKFQSLQEKGYPLNETIATIAKDYDTTYWDIPIHHVPEVNVINPQLTPMADMIPRVTTQSDEVKVTAETDQPSISFGLENTSENQNEEYSYADGSYSTYSYSVVGYGVASRLEDKMILVSDQIRSTQSVAEQAHTNAIRQEEEKQILLGTDNDDDGFDGCTDHGSQYETINLDDEDGSDFSWKEKIRELIDKVEEEGGDPSSIAVFVDFDTHRKLRNELDSLTRYESPGEELGFGFRVLEFDGVPVMKSHALANADDIDDGEEEDCIFAVDMSDHYMAMLQDMTVKPLAKLGPQERFATDAYGTFVSEAKSKIQYITLEETE